MAEPGIGTRGGSIDLLTALDLLGKAEARVAELEAALTFYANPENYMPIANDLGNRACAALAAVRQEKP
jgi:hypothetical protein